METLSIMLKTMSLLSKQQQLFIAMVLLPLEIKISKRQPPCRMGDDATSTDEVQKTPKKRAAH